jgi:dihydroorotate dehydrogenase electron transfer subunit
MSPPTAAKPHEAPAWSQVRARVLSQRDYGPGHRWLDLEVPPGFRAPEAGQFMQLLLLPPSPVLLPRPMSVAGVTRSGRRTVVGFLYGPVGAGTRALARLVPGDEVDALGPLGRGYPLERPGTPVLVAGGRGVAPLLFAADVLRRGGRRCEFFFGARSRAQLVGLDDARRRLGRLGGRLHVATDDGSRGFGGTVVGLLDRAARRLEGPLAIHACGPHGMLKAVALWALRHDAQAWLAMESVMACGTGVCRGCPLPRSEASRTEYLRTRGDAPSLLGNSEYAMCCTEGPVFAASDLDWDRVE